MIKVLDKSVYDKIAAGEVIERPVSIVKELVENSLDSGATNIAVEIKNGGKSYIRVSDNGCGIPENEVETAFLRHATSKINTQKDLDSIETLGFRGEALSSIAAVTRTELVTKTKEQKTGAKITIHGGEVLGVEKTGCPDGTTIIVTDLFYNTPARLKFLKQDATESAKIIDFISEIALCFKDVKFKFINNGKVLFSTMGDGNRLNTIIRVFPDVNSKNLVSVDYEESGLKLEGYISTPVMSKNTRSSQIFFVNGRVVSSKVMEKGVNLGYKERLFEGRYPYAYLFLSVDPSTIDCNVHPNKREVRFDDEKLVTDFIGRAIVESLKTKEAVVRAGNLFESKNSEIKEEPFAFKSKSIYEEEQLDINSLLSTLTNDGQSLRIEAEAERIVDAASTEVVQQNVESEKPSKDTPSIEIERPVLRPFEFDDLRVTGVIFDTYITCVDDSNFYLFDQHAAHERIFYEDLVGQYENSEKYSQPLLLPSVINVSISADSERQNWLDPLCRMGFVISEFGPQTYRIEEIPMFMELEEAEDFVESFIDGISDSTDLRNTVVVDKLIMMSCKAAVKANDVLKPEEVKALIDRLSQCRNPFSCPHGRPTFIKMSRYEIERLFKRV